VYIYIYIHICIYMYVCVYIYIYIYFMYILVCLSIRQDTYIYVHIYRWNDRSIDVHVCVYVYIQYHISWRLYLCLCLCPCPCPCLCLSVSVSVAAAVSVCPCLCACMSCKCVCVCVCGCISMRACVMYIHSFRELWPCRWLVLFLWRIHTYTQRMHAHTHKFTHARACNHAWVCVCDTPYAHVWNGACTCVTGLTGHVDFMGWLRSVGSLKLYVSFAKEPYQRDDILQKTCNFIDPTNRSYRISCSAC